MVGLLAYFDLPTDEDVAIWKDAMAKAKEKDEAKDALAKRKEARMKAMKAQGKAKAKAQANKKAGKAMTTTGKAMQAMRTMKTVKPPECFDADKPKKAMRAKRDLSCGV